MALERFHRKSGRGQSLYVDQPGRLCCIDIFQEGTRTAGAGTVAAEEFLASTL